MKYLLVLSVAIGLTSGYFGKQWSAEIEALVSAAPQFERDAEVSSKLLANVEKGLNASQQQEAVSLEEASTEFFQVLQISALRNGLATERLALESSVSSETIKVGDMAKPIGDTGLKGVRYLYSAQYKSLEGIEAFIQAFKNLPVAIVRLKIVGTSVEMDFAVYGK